MRSTATVAIAVFVAATAQAGEIPPAGVVNSASFLAGAVSPGLIVTIFGDRIGPQHIVTLAMTPDGMVDTLLADTRVFFDGVAAPLIYVYNKQVSAIVPYSVAGKTSVQVQVEYSGVRTNLLTVPVADTAPALFTSDSSGRGPAAAFNQDFSYNGPLKPAPPGSIVVLYGTGEGLTTPAGVDGKPALAVYPKPMQPVSAKIGGLDADVLYAGAAPALVAGVLQINLRIPPGVPSGPAPVVVTIGDRASQAGVTVFVQ